jgi:hypothetical protein
VVCYAVAVGVGPETRLRSASPTPLDAITGHNDLLSLTNNCPPSFTSDSDTREVCAITSLDEIVKQQTCRFHWQRIDP